MELEPQTEDVDAFVESLSMEMLSYCGSIFIAPGRMTYPEEMIDSGTYSLIDTGERQLLVTCDHVWQEYLKRRAKNADAALCLNLGEGDATIAFSFPERQLIDSDPDLDLAVFNFEPGQIRVNKHEVNHRKDWFPIRRWPIPKVGERDSVVLMGFPGKRITKQGRLCTFTAHLLPFEVNGVGHLQFYILNTGENTEVYGDASGSLGGLSGSPAYTIDKDGASLAGFVKSGYKRAETETSAGGDSLFAGSLLLTHACFLQQDGTLARP